jgi:dTDP-4-dehydrorhamnose reductase
MSSRIFVTGASGFLGWNIADHFRGPGCTVIGQCNSTPPHHSVASEWITADLLDTDAHRLLERVDCDAVVHCAAMASRADCDADPEAAQRLNAVFPATLAAACEARGYRFIHISTDLVFDGCHAPYSEDAACSPLSVYGASKAQGEHAVLSANRQSCIIRTSLMYGNGPFSTPGGMLAWTLEALRSQQALKLYTNQYRSLLYARDVARLVQILIETPSLNGVFHAGGPERISRYDAGRRIARVFGYSEACISPALVGRSDGLTPDDDTTLDSTMTRRVTGITFTSPDEGLRLTANAMV